MRFDIITIFPKIFDSYFNESIIKRAREKKLIDIRIHNLRDFSRDKHKKVDDKPYAGGPGMVMALDPLVRAISSLKPNDKKAKIILFSAAGKQFTSHKAREYSKKYNRIIMICGRYEGIDERFKKIFKMEEISIGPYVLTGGEIPALAVVDALSRHIPGVLGSAESLEEARYGAGMPVFTRPEAFIWKGKKYRVPAILLSGDHKKIEAWRKKQQKRD